MGQNGSIPNNPLFSDWKQSSQESSIYINCKTGDHVERFTINIEPGEESIYKKRMQEQHLFIVKVYYYQISMNKGPKEPPLSCTVYTDHVSALRKNKWQQVISALSILKGFRRLSTSFGLMRVTEDMVSMN